MMEAARRLSRAAGTGLPVAVGSNEGLDRMFAYRRIVMNTLFGSSMYSPNGPQYAKPKLS